MRLENRPGFVLHRAFHHAQVRFQVWRNNRSAAEAFRDAEAYDVIYRRRALRWAQAPGIALAALLLTAFTASVWHFQKPKIMGLLQEAAAGTAADLPGPPKGASGGEGKAAAPGGPAATASVAISDPQPETPARFPADAKVLLACKKDRTLYAYARRSGGWARVAAFPMAIGRNAGDKSKRGDARTPEGRFWITGMVAGPSQGPLYGALVFPLNYPRPSDRAEGKGGDGIWIHGVPAGTLPSFTHGCISLANEDVVALASLADAGTPIVILSDSLGPDPAKQIDTVGIYREYPAIAAAYGRRTAADSAARAAALAAASAFLADEQKRFPDLAMHPVSEADRKDILARLEKWRTDWSGRALEAYASNYDPAFRDRYGRSRGDFLERKARIFASKTRIQMEIRDPRIESESYGRVRVAFRQDYLAEGPGGVQRSSETKTLRLEDGPQGWLIITE
jgi:murein L,D-transpeptidase YafK